MGLNKEMVLGSAGATRENRETGKHKNGV